MRTTGVRPDGSAHAGVAATRPLPALLSQVLVAYTVEFDNEFERRMAEAGHPGAPLSLVVWSNLVRFLAAGARPVRDLAAQALAPEARIKSEVGCLERWRFVALEGDPADHRPIPTRIHRLAGRVLRDGWGSGRGIRSGYLVRLTRRGGAAAAVWPPLVGAIERRWQGRFGQNAIGDLRKGLESVAGELELQLPQGLPAGWEEDHGYPARGASPAEDLPLPALLSQVLLAFRIEFDRESRAPLILCANTLRVLGPEPIPVSQLPRLTGGSPESTDIGWWMKPYVAVEPNPAGRGKLARLSERGLKAQQGYRRLTDEIEARWEDRFGRENIRRLRESLTGLFDLRNQNGPALAQGLVPAEGTVRAGHQAPALGRRDIAAAARQRMRDLVAQTEWFRQDLAAALPHYPLWDINRGFGP